MYKVAICDDDKNYVKKLKQMILDINPENLTIYEYYSGEELLEQASLCHELIIIDVQLQGISGTVTARRLRHINKSGILVFCSGVQNPTTESFKMSPYRYIMKQFSDVRISGDLREILIHMKNTFGNHYLVISNKQIMTRINVHSILYVSKLKRGSLIHIAPEEQAQFGASVRSSEHLEEIYNVLKFFGFEYAHDSYIINCNWVDQFTKGIVKLRDGEILNISRSKYDPFKTKMLEFWGSKYDKKEIDDYDEM